MQDTGATDQRDFHAHELTEARHGAKRKARFIPLALAAAAWGGLSACSTPGPAHAYLLAPDPADASSVRDVDPRTGQENARLPTFGDPGEKVLGLAYDPYTDHLYLRLSPGNLIRVIDRPAGAVKRVTHAPNLPLGGHDLAIRSRDRHLFFTDPTSAALIETTLHGDLVAYLPLAGLTAPVWGVAHDARTDELLILAAAISTQVLRFSPSGERVGALELARPVRGISLAYDSVERLHYARLADDSAIGVFDAHGALVRTFPAPADGPDILLDLGPRSLLRLF